MMMFREQMLAISAADDDARCFITMLMQAHTVAEPCRRHIDGADDFAEIY